MKQQTVQIVNGERFDAFTVMVEGPFHVPLAMVLDQPTGRHKITLYIAINKLECYSMELILFDSCQKINSSWVLSSLKTCL